MPVHQALPARWPRPIQDRSARAVLAALLLLGPLVLGATLHAVEVLLATPANAFALVAVAGAGLLVAAGFVVAASLRTEVPQEALRRGLLLYLAVGIAYAMTWSVPALLRGQLAPADVPLLLGFGVLGWPAHLLFAFGCGGLGLAELGVWTVCP